MLNNIEELWSESEEEPRWGTSKLYGKMDAVWSISNLYETIVSESVLRRIVEHYRALFVTDYSSNSLEISSKDILFTTKKQNNWM